MHTWSNLTGQNHGTYLYNQSVVYRTTIQVVPLGLFDIKTKVVFQYRVAHLLAILGWVDLDLGSSLGWWPLL